MIFGSKNGGANGRWIEPVGRGLGESIPKGIDDGFVKLDAVTSEQPLACPLRSTAAHELNARWPDLTRGCAPEAGHLADSMPEAEVEEQGLQLNQNTCSLICKKSELIPQIPNSSRNDAQFAPKLLRSGSLATSWSLLGT